MPSTTSILLILTTGICLQVAISHLLAWGRQRGNPINASFGLLCLLGAGFAYFTFVSLHQTTYESFRAADDLKRHFLRLLVAFIAFFLAYYAERKPDWKETALAAGFIGLELIHTFIPSGAFLARVTDFRIIQHPFGGPLPSISGVMGWGGYTLYGLYALLLTYVVWTISRLFRTGRTLRGAWLSLTFLLTLFAYGHDLHSDYYGLPNSNIGEYTIFLFLLLVGIDLGVRRIKAERDFQALFHSLNDAVFVHDAHTGTILDVNETACRMYRQDRDSLVGSDVSLLTEEDPAYSPERALQLIHQTLHEGPRVFEWRCRRIDGVRFWAEVSLRSAELADRPVVLATVRDVTDRVRERERLEQSEELNKAIVEGFDGMLFILGGDRRVEYMNQRLIDRLGRDGTHEPYEEALQGFFQDPRDPHLTAWAEGKAHHEVEGRDDTWYDVFATTLTRSEGHSSTLVLIQDITLRKRADAAKDALVARIHHGEKLESLGVLAGGAAHDFNNLLTAILGNADLASEAAGEGSPVQEPLSKLKKAAHKAADLTKQLLAYSGRGRFKSEPVAVNEMVRDVAEMLRVSLSSKPRILFQLDPEGPLALADPLQVRQVVMNLLTNASEAMAGTEGAITFVTGRSLPLLSEGVEPSGQPLPPQPMVMLEVRDEGRGMDEETRRRLFEPFYSTKFAGRGLGMAAVLGIIKGHQGFIQVHSTPGKGTTIRVWFPPAEANITVPSERSKPLPALRRALVVDDEPMVCDAVAGSLRSLGWMVTTALDGPSALEALETMSQPPDLALVDLTMPRMDGRETARRIRAKHPGIRILIMSGAYATSHDDPEGFREVDGFLPKPFTLPELRNHLREQGK